MAGSLSNARTVSAFITSKVSALVTRRGYAAASEGTASLSSGAPSVMLKKGSETSNKNSWGPDPVTGYYRPDNQTKEIDAAELRQMHAENRNTQH